jgi:hypothetical protein
MTTQLDFYVKNQSGLLKLYEGKIIALKDGEVLGVYPSKAAALHATLDAGHAPGSFMIILCTQGDGEYTARFTYPTFDKVSLD